MLLFEKIAESEKDIDDEIKKLQARKNQLKAEAREAAELKKNTITFPDGTSVDKRTYPKGYFDNISVGEKPLPTDAYLYTNPHTYDEVYHNSLVRAREQRGPKSLLDRFFDKRHKREMKELTDKIYNSGRTAARESFIHDMNRGANVMAREAQQHAKAMHVGKLQALGILGAGGLIGGGALLSANRGTPAVMPMSNPMHYEQDYYH